MDMELKLLDDAPTLQRECGWAVLGFTSVRDQSDKRSTCSAAAGRASAPLGLGRRPFALANFLLDVLDVLEKCWQRGLEPMPRPARHRHSHISYKVLTMRTRFART